MTTDLVQSAAIKWEGLVLSMDRPARHGDLIRELSRLGLPEACHGEQGFVTSDGKFVDRQSAYEIAMRAGQILATAQSLFPGRDLFTEDLW